MMELWSIISRGYFEREYTLAAAHLLLGACMYHISRSESVTAVLITFHKRHEEQRLKTSDVSRLDCSSSQNGTQ
jgi:hypothetical protein